METIMPSATSATETGIEPLVERLRDRETAAKLMRAVRDEYHSSLKLPGGGLSPLSPNDLWSIGCRAVERANAEAANIIEATRTPEAAQGWQPIETAPKDGTRLWCFAAAYRDQFVARWVQTTGGPRWHNLSANEWAVPTYWQPLPAPPALAQVRHPSGD